MKREIIIGLLLFFIVEIANSFFIQSRDIRRILRTFPKAFEIDTNQKSRPLINRRRENSENNHSNDNHYNHNHHDRYDADEESVCSHPEHKKYPENRIEKPQKNKYEDEVNDYKTNKKHYEEKKTNGEKEHEESTKYEKPTVESHNNNKDYITGILVTIPKTGHGDLENYYQGNKQTVLLHQLLRDDHHHHIREDGFEAYLY